MKRKIVSGMMLIMFLANVLSMFFNLLPAVDATEVLFEEDFESYAVGSFPSHRFYARWGGWRVTEEEGNKFLRSVSYETSNYDMITRQKFPGHTAIEYMVRHTRFYTPEQAHISAYQINGLDVFPGVFSVYLSVRHDFTAVAYYWWSPDGVHFEEGAIEASSPVSIESGMWYKVKVVLGEGYAKLYIDDTFILEISGLPFTIDDFHMYWGTWGQRDIDNIRVYRPPTIVSATINIDPNTLNPRSRGRWITSYIELPEGYNVGDIDVSTIMLNDTIPAESHPTEIGDYDEDGILDLMVKFDRQEVIALLSVGEATLTVTGEVNEIPFEGSDTIRVIGE